MIVLVAAAVVVLVWGLWRRDPQALARVPLRAPWVPLVVVAVQAVALEVIEGRYGVALAIHTATYVAALAWLWSNREIRGLWLIGLGALLNATAVAVNGGVMPAASSALDRAGLRAEGGFVNSARSDSAVGFLGDVFAVPAGMPLANVFSIGDVLLVVGLALLLWQLPRSGGPAAAPYPTADPLQDA